MEHTDSKILAETAHARGAHVHLVDGHPTDKMSTMEAIAAALSFPDYFGRNLDALYDCLTDLSWLPGGEHVLIWGGAERLKEADPRAYLAIRSVLSDAERALAPGGDRADSRRLTVAFTDD